MVNKENLNTLSQLSREIVVPLLLALGQSVGFALDLHKKGLIGAKDKQVWQSRAVVREVAQQSMADAKYYLFGKVGKRKEDLLDGELVPFLYWPAKLPVVPLKGLSEFVPNVGVLKLLEPVRDDLFAALIEVQGEEVMRHSIHLDD